MTGIQVPESAIHTESRLRKNALLITRTFGSLLSNISRDPYGDPNRSKFKTFPIIESNLSEQKKIYSRGLRIPLNDKTYRFLEIGLSQDAFEKQTGHTSLLLRLVTWEKEDDFSCMPRLCSRDSYALDEHELNMSLAYSDIWAGFSTLCIDRKKTFELVKGYLDNPDTCSLGQELKEALLKLGLVNLLYLN